MQQHWCGEAPPLACSQDEARRSRAQRGEARPRHLRDVRADGHLRDAVSRGGRRLHASTLDQARALAPRHEAQAMGEAS